MPHQPYPPNGHLSQWILDQFEPGYKGWAIDIGASDGKSINTTWALEKSHGWTCLCVEPNPDFYPMLVKERAFVEKCAVDDKSGSGTLSVNVEYPEAYSALRVTERPDTRGVTTAEWKKVEVRVATVDEILEKWQYPQLDALCIDTEGTEGDILRGCDLARWKPKVIVIEAWEAGSHDEYLLTYGYIRKARSVDNDLYVLEGK